MATANKNILLKVGFLCYDLSPASAGTMNRLARNLENIEVKAFPLLNTAPSTVINFSYEQSNIRGRFFTFNTIARNAPESMWFGLDLKWIRRLVTESDIICLLGIQGLAAFVTAIVAKLGGKPVVAVNQTMGPLAEKKRHWIIRITKGWVLKNSQVIIAQTPPTVETLIKVYNIPQNNIVMAPWDGAANEFGLTFEKYKSVNKTSVREKLGIPLQGYAILFCGSLIYLKGIDTLICAFRKLLNREDNSYLYVIGPDGGSDGKEIELKKLVGGLGLEEKVFFLGKQDWDTISEYYCACDVFVLPTRKDMWPKVLIEAGMSGLPLITTTTCGGAYYLVKDDVNGYVIPPDDIASLEEALIKLLNKDIRVRMGIASKKIVSDYIDNNDHEVQGFKKAFDIVLSRVAGSK